MKIRGEAEPERQTMGLGPEPTAQQRRVSNANGQRGSAIVPLKRMEAHLSDKASDIDYPSVGVMGQQVDCVLGLLPGVRQRWIETATIGTHNFSMLSEGKPRLNIRGNGTAQRYTWSFEDGQWGVNHCRDCSVRYQLLPASPYIFCPVHSGVRDPCLLGMPAFVRRRE
jgi:hypothetical protein